MVDHRMKSCSTCGAIYELVHDCPLKKQKPKEDVKKEGKK